MPLSASKNGNSPKSIDQIPPVMLLDNKFGDFDAFAESARGWDLDFRQLDQGKFEAKLTHLVTPEALLAECALSRKVEQCGAPPAGFRTFSIPGSDILDLRWRGKDVSSDELLLFPKADALDSVSNPGFHVFAFSVSENSLEKAAERRGVDSVDSLFPGSEVVRPNRDAMLGLRSKALGLTSAAATSPGALGNSAFRDALAIELVDDLLDAVADGAEQARAPIARTRTRALRRALEIITDRADEPVSVVELERLSGARGRTLRYAFEEAFGVSPKAYLQSFRLDRARRALRNADSGATTVGDVANAWGFWHMGQFARDFRKAFGELPSAVLAGSQRPCTLSKSGK